MKEIGGYIELDTYHGKMLHEDAVKLNCGRNVVEYLIKTRNIQRVWMPKFMCSSCTKMFLKHNVEVVYYSIDRHFKPINIDRQKEDWLFLVNYYGQLSNEYLSGFGKNSIIDSSMAYYQQPINGIDTFFSCRKYFGVPDGAILITDTVMRNLPRDISYKRMNHLLGRYEVGAKPFYHEYVENNHSLSDVPLMGMSRLTENLLRGIDYDKVKRIRTGNFQILHNELNHLNQLDIILCEGAYMYPFYIDNGAKIRKSLQEKDIFIPTLWPAVYQLCDENDLEYDFAKNILPLPVDQRYNETDMQFIVENILKYM